MLRSSAASVFLLNTCMFLEVNPVAVFFFFIWILISGQVSVGVCLSGAVVSTLLYVFCVKVLGYRAGVERRSAKKTIRAVRYLGYLLVEMLKAGFVVMKLIYTRGKNMEPLLVEFSTDLKTETHRTVLANSITLTAGTITVFLEDGSLCVHALDRSLAEGLEHTNFERRLKELEE